MRVIIIGNGVAGITAAETVRKNNSECEILILSADKFPYYSRPRLIEYLGGKISVRQLIIHGNEWYEGKNIKIKICALVKKIDCKNNTITTAEGLELNYDYLVIASGAVPFVPDFPGTDAEGVFTLRSIEDADAIMTYAKGKKKAAILGGGLLGIEAAISMISLVNEVTVIETFDRLLQRQLDAEGAQMLKNMLEAKGLKFLIGKKTEKIIKKENGLGLIFKDGTELDTEVMLVSAGIRPAVTLAKEAGLEVNKGIVVDDFMRTAIANVFACGDVAEHKGKLYGIWPVAKDQGYFCGTNVTGQGVSYPGSFVSTRLKVAGIEVASLGNIEEEDGVEIITKKDEPAGIYKKLFLKENKLIGAILLGDAAAGAKLQGFIKSQEDMTFLKSQLI